MKKVILTIFWSLLWLCLVYVIGSQMRSLLMKPMDGPKLTLSSGWILTSQGPFLGTGYRSFVLRKGSDLIGPTKTVRDTEGEYEIVSGSDITFIAGNEKDTLKAYPTAREIRISFIISRFMILVFWLAPTAMICIVMYLSHTRVVLW